MGMAANPPPPEPSPGPSGKKKQGRKKRSEAGNLLLRLCKYEKATLAFIHDVTAPFDNNLGERDIRMMKVQQKISVTS